MHSKFDLSAVDVERGTAIRCPLSHHERTLLGDAAGLSQFGVNLLRLPPGTWSSQRHWQIASDEFIYVVGGEVVLITEEEIAGHSTFDADRQHERAV